MIPDKDKRILFQAALRVVAREGFSRTTLQKIALEAWITEENIHDTYRFFSTSELVKEALAAELHLLDETVPQASLHLEDDLVTIARNYQSFWRERPHLLALVPEASRHPEIESVFLSEQQVVVDKFVALCLHHRSNGVLVEEFDQLSPELLEWHVSSLIIGPLLAQEIWKGVGLRHGEEFDLSLLVRNVLQGIGREKTTPRLPAPKSQETQDSTRPYTRPLNTISSGPSFRFQSTLPAELDLRIRVNGQSRGLQLIFDLTAPTGKAKLAYKTIVGVENNLSLEQYRLDLTERLEGISRSRDSSGNRLQANELAALLDNLGHSLYKDLFPPELKQAYGNFREEIESIQIFSDEPWIPWEMVKPFEKGPKSFYDPFLCEKFILTRWLTGDRNAPSEAKVRRFSCVDVGDAIGHPSLEDGRVECEGLKWWLSERPGMEDVSPQHATIADFLQVLNGGVDLLHFAGHGSAGPDLSDGSSIQLRDGFLTTERIGERLKDELCKNKPFVFFNSCRSSYQGVSLTGLRGWVDFWLNECNASGFVGAQWGVPDDLACLFAREFYRSLIQGRTGLGEAAKMAREKVRDAEPGNPAWLAYTVYGHPYGRVKFGSEG